MKGREGGGGNERDGMGELKGEKTTGKGTTGRLGKDKGEGSGEVWERGSGGTGGGEVIGRRCRAIR